MKALWALVFGLGAAGFSWSITLPEVQALVDRATRGQTILVPAGTYRGHLVVRNPVVLRFQPGARLLPSPGTEGPTLWVQGSDVTVQGLELVGTGEGTRRNQTALVVTGSRVQLLDLTLRQGWSGLWLDGATDVTIGNLEVTGRADLPFWKRGEAIRITQGRNIRLGQVRIRAAADGIYAERSSELLFQDCRIEDARYGVHSMFSTQGSIQRLTTDQTVVGVMLMESRSWVVRDSVLRRGYRTGSAGVREIRTQGVSFEGNQIARQASGVELIDVRDGTFRNNRITENGIAWTWGRDNSGTLVQNNVHRGNLLDFAGDEPSEQGLGGPEPHHPGTSPEPLAVSEKITVRETALHVRPQFDRNFWDGWHGTDLDQDGLGDTPYRFDGEAAVRAATRPWAGVFLGSPWSLWSQGLSAGDPIDEHPLDGTSAP